MTLKYNMNREGVENSRGDTLLNSGYSSAWSSAWISLFNVTLAAIMIVCSSPLLLLTSLLVLKKLGRPILYKGVRLGKNKKPFVMYKFRTLPENAQQEIGPNLLSYKTMMVPPFAKFLRDSRLDELPQLFNILKGDMDFIGPRPERPEIYESMCKDIHGYDRRFIVKPGLIGFSQLFTPHGAPKRLRSMIDFKLVCKERTVSGVIFLISYCILLLSKQTCIKSFIYLKELIKRLVLHLYSEKRHSQRLRLKGVKVFAQDAPSHIMTLVDINEDYISTTSNTRIDHNNHTLILEKEIRNCFRTKRKRAVCHSKVYKIVKINNSSFRIVIRYTPISNLNQYMIDQYFLRKSIG